MHVRAAHMAAPAAAIVLRPPTHRTETLPAQAPCYVRIRRRPSGLSGRQLWAVPSEIVRVARRGTVERAKAHVPVCMLVYHLTWHLRRTWVPLNFAAEDSSAAGKLLIGPGHDRKPGDQGCG
jgi:hypothetical protein